VHITGGSLLVILIDRGNRNVKANEDLSAVSRECHMGYGGSSRLSLGAKECCRCTRQIVLERIARSRANDGNRSTASRSHGQRRALQAYIDLVDNLISRSIDHISHVGVGANK